MTATLATNIKDAVIGQRDTALELIRELVEIESPSLEPDRVEPVFERLAAAYGELGFDLERVTGKKTAGYLKASRGGEGQLLLGHADTVWPVGTLKEMPLDVDGSIVSGPGVYDMKAGLVQMITAIRAIDSLGVEMAVPPVVLVTGDEEIGSHETRDVIEATATNVRRTFVLEPSLGVNGSLKTRRKGTGHYDVEVIGRASHAGLAPEQGRSAIFELSFVIQQLFGLNDAERGITVNVGTIDGGLRPNVVAPHSTCGVDVRVAIAEDATRIDAAIRALKPTTPDVIINVRGGLERPPLEKTARNAALWARAGVHAEALSIDIAEGIAGGGSDGNYTSCLTATLDGLGAVGDGAHALHEHIDLDRSLQRAALLAMLMLDA
jgi:glutamate carboxypeptidase